MLEKLRFWAKPLIVIVVGAAITVFVICSERSEKAQEEAERILRSRKIAEKKARRETFQKRRQAMTSRASENDGWMQTEKPAKEALLTFSEEEERQLTELAREAILELRDAIDREDVKAVRRIIAKMMRSPQKVLGLAEIPAFVKRKMIEALGWFGSDSIPELVEFMVDADPEIVQEAVNQFQQMLNDFSMSDRERAVVVVNASKVLNDIDQLEPIIMEICTMRHSVSIGTLVEICETGTDAAHELLQDYAEFYTGEEDMSTVETLESWLAKNPDGENDEEFYGRWE